MWELVKFYNQDFEPIEGYHNRFNPPSKFVYYRAINVWLITRAGKIIIQKRSENKQLYPNYYECVCGAVVENESIEQAAVREVKEELGIEIDITKLNLIDERLHKAYNYFMFTFYVIVEDNISKDIKINKNEVSEFKLISFQQLEDIIKKYEIAPSIQTRYKFYKDTIWYLTKNK